MAIDYIAPRLTRRQIHRVDARNRQLYPELKSYPDDVVGYLEKRL